jgi:hypothetical protein
MLSRTALIVMGPGVVWWSDLNNILRCLGTHSFKTKASAGFLLRIRNIE